MIRRIEKSIRQIFNRVPVPWAMLGPVSRMIARQFPLKSPPLLILSMPRSGSSWIGRVLGTSKSAAYLHEPITQSYLRCVGIKNLTVFEILPEDPLQVYESAADNTFAGIPSFPRGVTKKRSQWKLKDRKHKRLVVKEVNPLAIKWFMDNYKPRIIYIIRHPAAVANSFSALGWMGSRYFKIMFSERIRQNVKFKYDKFDTSFWSSFGAVQSVITNMSMEVLKNYGDYKIIKHEDVCSDPLETFRQLYRFADLKWDSDIEELIIAQSDSEEPSATGEYGEKRNSGSIINKWKNEMDQNAIDELKAAYLACDPSYYNADQW